MKLPPEAQAAIAQGLANEDYLVDLELLGLSQRLINLLEGAGIVTLRDLIFTPDEKLLEIKNFGEKAIKQVYTALSKYHKLNDLRTIKPLK